MRVKNGFSPLSLVLPTLVLIALIGIVVFLSQKGNQNPTTPIISNEPKTDPSYLTIYTNINVTTKVFSPYNEEITGYNDIENPIAAEGDSIEISGEALNVFSLPKPPYGKYRVRLEGTGAYQADISVIGKDGSLTSKTIRGEISESKAEEIFIDIGDESRILDTDNFSSY